MTDPPSYPTATFVTDPATGERLLVERDPEYLQIISAHYESLCTHADMAVYRIKVANGAIQVRDCCSGCGQGFGAAKSQKDRKWVESLPWLSDDVANAYEARTFAQKQKALVALARKQQGERGAFSKGYAEYLNSPEWREKRKLVLKRCGDLCEGCGVKAATEVHHSTYEHLFDEFLFELLGLCHGCHDRIEREKRERREAEHKPGSPKRPDHRSGPAASEV